MIHSIFNRPAITGVMILMFGFSFISPAQKKIPAKELTLFYDKPAGTWNEALPLGNGRIGAMVFGRVGEELIQLNEATLWTGGPVQTNVNPGSKDYLPLVRQALFNNQFEKATELVKKMQGLYSENYLPMADLSIKQDLKDMVTSSYSRRLNIRDAVSTTTFRAGGTTLTREMFISAPSQIVVIRLTADRSHQINLSLGLSSLLSYTNTPIDDHTLSLKGKAPAHSDPVYVESTAPVVNDDSTHCNGMRFELLMSATTTDGTVFTDSNGLHISHATEALVLLSAATSFNGFDKCPDREGKDEHALALNYLGKAATQHFSALLKDHLDDYHHYFNRVALAFNNNRTSKSVLPTDMRLQKYSAGGDDDGLEALYFQYGRYLLISSSRTPGAPANLQGIWNRELRPPWSSNYTININTQMNYWPAEVTNLSEMTGPLVDLIRNISVTGRTTAKEFYGLHGWVAHHNSDIWALSNPVGNKGNGDPKWANWAMGANWLTRHLWEHYLFTGDKKFLQEVAYPIMKGAARFSMEWLIPDSSGYLVTAPSGSPENDYYYDGDRVSGISIASTMDISIIRDLFSNVLEAGKALQTDSAYLDTLTNIKNKLFPFRIGHKGNLQEWYKDYEDVEVHHRHVSHLFGLYPGNQISPVSTPRLADAAKKTLELRGDDGTGWSLAWKINFWARLFDGDHAYTLYRKLFRLTADEGYNMSNGGGVYANLFDAHPPFQIDGNFGGTAGVSEMLLQSQQDELHLLPALPAKWATGYISGLRARGGFVVDMKWSSHHLTRATVLSLQGGICHIRTDIPVRILNLNVRSMKSSVGYLLSLPTLAGMRYTILPQ